MAKSLRSKRKRKVRAEKRIVNAKKELVKLKEVAARLHGTSSGGQQLTKESLEESIPDIHVNNDAMSVDGESLDSAAVRLSNKGGMKINTQWMNQRKIKAIKSKIRKHNKKKGRRGGRK